ncbi:MAG: endonuclease/exonuclease/phosphatase family protein [Bacteroidales bacterium]|nr:endonuclease/exonuclease/phosphatase family protein [Bacteroidales bacterium]
MKKVIKFLLGIIATLVLFYVYGTGDYRDGNYYQTKVFENEQQVVGDTLSIMTYNIGWLSGMTNNLPVDRSEGLYVTNLNNCIAALSSSRNNIIAFQEIDVYADRSFNYNQSDTLAKRLNYKHESLAVNWDKAYVPFPGVNPKYFFGTVVSAQCILSDLEILENSAEKLIKPINAPFYYNAFYLDRLIQKTVIKTNKGDLMILNVHLEAFDEETRNIHIKRTIEVFDSYRNKMPTLLVGDFNSPQWQEKGRNTLLGELFKMDNVSNAIPDSVYNKDMFKYNTYPSDNPTEKIDFIFYSSDKIKTIDFGVMQGIASPSDHSPVWMKFVIK